MWLNQLQLYKNKIMQNNLIGNSKNMKQKLTQYQKMVHIKCVRCGSAPKKSFSNFNFITHVCSCGNVYWSLNQCPNCDRPQLTILNQKPQTGQPIKCVSCGFCFHMFRCPRKQCQNAFWLKYGTYRVGQILKCQQCSCQFKLIICQCGGQLYRTSETDIIQGMSLMQCGECQKKFVYKICHQCLKTDYYPEALQIGDRIKCSHCAKKNVFVPCPNCKRTTDLQKFSFCEPCQCNYCKAYFELSKCPYGCGVNFFLNDQIQGAIKTCKGPNCNGRNYIVINCQKCHQSVYIQQYKEGASYEDECPTCRSPIKYYFCIKCKKLNPSDSKCQLPTCPRPVEVISYLKQQSQTASKQNEDRLNQNYEEKQCKLCFSQPSVMMNTRCYHIMMCKDCFQQYKKKNTVGRFDQISKNTMSCPVCKVIGYYVQYKKPRYC